MNADLFNVGLAFIEGFALILSPCILPILPIILSGSLTGSKSRPLGIILGFILTFTAVTLFSRALIELAHISEDTLRYISFGILLLLGIMMMSSYLTEKFNLATQRLTRVGSSLEPANNPQSGFWGGLLFGGLVGIIWTPCAGPILAAVIVQVIVQHTNLSSIFTVVAFAIGAGLPMMLIALLGRGIIKQFGFIKQHTDVVRKLLGCIIVLTVIYLMTVGSATVGATPPVTNNQYSVPTALTNKLEKPYRAPAIAGITTWINSAPINLSSLRGKVVLIDFWTYSCINCVRTLPYIKEWYAKYHDQGLVIIGVHSPEFQFEHDSTNVKNAVSQDGILYPVALDNRFVTWQNYRNEYWPAHYLIDKNGLVVYEHFGEGEYDITENNIRYLLGVKDAAVPVAKESKYSATETPETYLGYERANAFANQQAALHNQVGDYHYPASIPLNHWALNGKWKIQAEKIISADANAAIRLHFTAGKVYVVMGTQGKSIPVKFKLNNKDIPNNQVNVARQQLYTLLSLNSETEGDLELIASAAGLEVYTFTFGE